MTTTMQRPTATTVSEAGAQRLRLAALLELARERDDPNLDYPELVALLEADSRRQQQRRRRRTSCGLAFRGAPGGSGAPNACGGSRRLVDAIARAHDLPPLLISTYQA
jgi:hypothetical protein